MGRPSKRAAHMRQHRLNETNEEREKRLSQKRKSTSIDISKETCEERKNRLSIMRAYMKKVLYRENIEKRTLRLGLIHDRLSNETEEQRAHRLGVIHNRLLNETQEQCAHRLGMIHDRLSNQTQEQRAHRLSMIHDRLSNETQEQRAHRLGMIHDRLSNETQEQRAHRLSMIHDRLSNETQEQRAHRLGMIHDRLSNETQEQRAHRLSMIHDRLSNETEEQRAHRLGVIHDRLSNETEEQRAHRLGVIHDRLSNETEEQRAHRLGVIHDRLSNETEAQRAHRLGVIHDRLSNETEEQRAHRLGVIHDRLSNETEEQRAHRLGLIRDRLLNETPETRSDRLSRMQQANQACRDITNQQSFEAAINIFADVPCAVCKRSLYPKQRSNLRANMYSILLPEELVALGTITTCSRCSNNIRKRKIPTTAYWNKMMPAEVPPELVNLTSVEERFLSRIVPFLKIVKLNNRFSQNWCKGQVILFAKDVVEIAEQLPLTPNQAGLVLVVESLENLSCSKEFVVDMQRLNRAFTWLISNNHLYSDVQVHFETTLNIPHILQIAENSIPEQDGVASETLSQHYITLNDNKAILRGSFNQGDLRFNLSRGKQCTGIAAVACAAFSVLDPNKWAKSDIDYIVIIGDKYYNDCIAARDNPAPGEVNPEYLAVSDLSPRLIYNRQNLVITVLEETNHNGHIDNDNTSDGFPNLKNALLSFFREHSNGILTANAISIAVHCRTLGDNQTYFLFDSHARGPKGASAPINGTACCMRFSELDDLHAIIRQYWNNRQG
ncbi:unnamed protein product [Parnassius apollo]|uniref:(apollo) hypothetical protein n=1 Tax=Parnassius apollo TaxID=110799 RepID=A0A8S3Y0Y8_PARAO|nr:unnamed protein product [Parnassius apollo]